MRRVADELFQDTPRRVADAYVAAMVALDPMLATALGLPDGADRFPDLSPAGAEAEAGLQRETLRRLAAAESAAGPERSRPAGATLRPVAAGAAGGGAGPARGRRAPARRPQPGLPGACRPAGVHPDAGGHGRGLGRDRRPDGQGARGDRAATGPPWKPAWPRSCWQARPRCGRCWSSSTPGWPASRAAGSPSSPRRRRTGTGRRRRPPPPPGRPSRSCGTTWPRSTPRRPRSSARTRSAGSATPAGPATATAPTWTCDEAYALRLAGVPPARRRDAGRGREDPARRRPRGRRSPPGPHGEAHRGRRGGPRPGSRR